MPKSRSRANSNVSNGSTVKKRDSKAKAKKEESSGKRSRKSSVEWQPKNDNVPDASDIKEFKFSRINEDKF